MDFCPDLRFLSTMFTFQPSFKQLLLKGEGVVKSVVMAVNSKEENS
jgi:hypothetical protein